MRPQLIGVVHLLPLPGAPRWGGSMSAVCEHAAEDAKAFAEGGADALVIENFGDVPFTSERVPAETVAAMATVFSHLRQVAKITLPFGFNVLRNDPMSGLGLAATCGGKFIRVNVHSGTMVTDQGVIEGQAYETVRKRQVLCPKVAIWADVHVKHAQPLGGGSLEDAAKDALHRGLADALIVSGVATGESVDADDLRVVRQACPEAAIYVGSGSSVESAPRLLEFADGLIVGTSVKVDGLLAQPVDPARVQALRAAMDAERM
ncbi:MAG: BtpA/SgcQ family protein [Verrucomicrobiales bacterium]|nr:BtpA/SgcQ family protein [Verrucomicrobiales bacterium]